MKVVCNGMDKVYKITCNKCDSDLEYTEKDVFEMQEERSGIVKTVHHLFKPAERFINVYMQTYRCIKCPVCGNVIKRMDLNKGIGTMRWEKVED